MRVGLITGHNVDPVDIKARGEEQQAERGAIDQGFHGITFTCWRRVLAAAVASGVQNERGTNG